MKKFIAFNPVFIGFVLMLCLVCCRKDPDPGGTAVQAMAGEWWVQVDGTGDYYHFATYNTASNSPNEMWLDDFQTFYEMKGKVTVDLSSLTFSTASTPNEYYDITFTIDSGKIIPGGAKGPVSQAVTDSITFVAEFSDDPGTRYNLSGYRRTRFAEDDH